MPNSKKQKFEHVYEKYFDKIYGYIFRYVCNHDDTEDITASIFIALWKNWDNLVEVSKVSSLIYAIAKNKLNDYLRKKYRIREMEIEYNELIDYKIESKNVVRNNKYRTILEELVAKLSQREMHFYELRFRRKNTLNEVSKEMNITLNNTKVIQNRLIKKLKKLWTEKKQNN